MDTLRDVFSSGSLETAQRIFNTSTDGLERALILAYINIQKGYLAKAKQLLDGLDLEQTELYGYYLICRLEALINLREFEEVSSLLLNLERVGNEQNDTLFLNNHMLYKGLMLLFHQEFMQAERLFQHLLDNIDPESGLRIYGQALEYMAYQLLMQGNFQKSMKFYKEAQEWYQNVNLIHSSLVAKIYYAMNLIYVGSFSEGKLIMNEVELEANKKELRYCSLLATTAMGDINNQMGHFELALMELSVAMELVDIEQLGNPSLHARILSQLAHVNFYLGGCKDMINLLKRALEANVIDYLKFDFLFWYIRGCLALGIDYHTHLNQLHELCYKYGNDKSILTKLTVDMLVDPSIEVDVDLFSELLASKSIEISFKMEATKIYVNHLLNQIVMTGNIETSKILQILGLIDRLQSYAESHNSIFHKTEILLLKAKFHVIEHEFGLATMCIDLAEKVVEEYGLNRYQNIISNIKSWIDLQQGVPDFYDRVFQDLGIMTDLLEVYAIEKTDNSYPVAFIVSKEEDVELLNIPLYSETTPSMFVTGLLHSVATLTKIKSEAGINNIEFGGFSIYFKSANNFKCWLIYRGKLSSKLEKKFDKAVNVFSSYKLPSYGQYVSLIEQDFSQQLSDEIRQIFME